MCRVRTIHGFRIIDSQKSAAIKLTALVLLVLIGLHTTHLPKNLCIVMHIGAIFRQSHIKLFDISHNWLQTLLQTLPVKCGLLTDTHVGECSVI